MTAGWIGMSCRMMTTVCCSMPAHSDSSAYSTLAYFVSTSVCVMLGCCSFSYTGYWWVTLLSVAESAHGYLI